jgi:rhamnogalacturonyl hydrolase YesR
LTALSGVDRDPRYTDYAVRWGESHHWGLVGGPATNSADNQCCGQTYLALYALDPRPERIRDLQASVAGMVKDPKTDAWWWCDALQMAMPVFARLGVMNHDPRYFEKMHALYEDAKTSQGGRGLYNPEEHLWWRDKSFLPPYKEPNGRNSYWARGNGWALAALIRVLEVLPADAPHRDEYLGDFQAMAAAILPLQRADGYWNVSLLDPGHFGGKEVTGTSLFIYGFATGIRLGFLPAKDYAPAVARAWTAMAQEAVHPDGFLGYVQGTGKQPSDSQPVTYEHKPDFDDFGLGCFLLAGSEVWRLAGGSAAGAP